MIGLSRIWRIRTTRCRFGRAKDECGTIKDELKKEEARRRSKRQAGRSMSGLETRAGMCRKTREMPVYDRSIKVLRYPAHKGWRPHEKLGFKV